MRDRVMTLKKLLIDETKTSTILPLKQKRDATMHAQDGLPSWADSLHPVANLYQVDNNLYRSEQLQADEAILLTKYNIKAVINLRFFDRHNNHQHFAKLPQLDGVAFYNCPLIPWHVPPQRIAAILSLIAQLQYADKAVLVHCYHGADRTGIVIAMYRIIVQGWTLEHAKAEMMQGNFGYHTLWRNLENMFTDAIVAQVRADYQSPL